MLTIGKDTIWPVKHWIVIVVKWETRSILKLYGNVKSVGWLGWFEDNAGRGLGFVTLGGMVVPLLV